MRALHSLSELVFPVRCLGCLTLGLEICSHCRADWNPHIYRAIHGNHENRVISYSAIQYSPTASRVLLAAKENALAIADNLVMHSLEHVLKYFQREIGGEILVPIPSRKSASRKRGRSFMAEITQDLSITSGLDFQDLLIHNRKVADQTTLHAREREENLAGAFSINVPNKGRQQRMRLGKIDREKPVIIIDDLVTTGSTLLEAARALRSGGFTVAGAVTACVAKPLR